MKYASSSVGALVVLMIQLIAAPFRAMAETEAIPTDHELNDLIRARLKADGNGISKHINVRSRDGVVMLSGSVEDLVAKEAAVHTAESVRGVREVMDLLSVAPTRRADEEIRREVGRALADFRAGRFGIGAAVTNGVVTLTGQVESWRDKQTAADAIKGIGGVRAICNQATVDYAIDRPDRQIHADILRRFETELPATNGVVNVSVRDGNVRLTGTVDSAPKKSQAIAQAWVPGVRYVDARRLTVDPFAREAGLRKEGEQTDEEIRQAVEGAFDAHPRLGSLHPVIEVEAGAVTLLGSVDQPQTKREAEQVARSVTGVKRVVNNLEVQSTGQRGDYRLIANISRAFSRDPVLGRLGIHVSAKDGLVHLNGYVYTEDERTRAGEIAATGEGVTGVQNNVAVLGETAPAVSEHSSGEGEPSGYDAGAVYPEPYCPPDYPWPYSDAQIRKYIKDRLFSDNFVNAFRVRVRVQDGVAILTGAVNNCQMRYRAELDAYESGARYVANYLLVRP